VTTTVLAQRIRRTVLEQSKRANMGHIGSSLSIAELIAVLLDGTLAGQPGDPDRDRFVLSKGHAALALYAGLHEIGRLDHEALCTFCTDGSVLGAHPEHVHEAIDFSTGSLGHGLSIAAGAALGARLAGSSRRAFALLSDAELNEGSVWEAAMFAAHHRLANLVAIIDANGQQALGYTADVLDLEPLGERWRAFGWDVVEADGHDCDALRAAMAPDPAAGAPRVVIARTTFGRGVPFMERQIAWHYWPMSDEQFGEAMGGLPA